MKCNTKLRPNYFFVKVSVLAVEFCQKFQKTDNFWQNFEVSKILKQYPFRGQEGPTILFFEIIFTRHCTKKITIFKKW